MPVEIVDFHESKFWIPDPKGFSLKLESLGMKDVKGKQELCLNFGVDNTNDEEIPRDLVIRGINKLKEDGKISDFFDIGKFFKSLRANGIKPMLLDNGDISTSPAIVGKVITMKPENPNGRKVTDENGEKVYYSWIVDSIQGAGTPAANETTAQAPKADMAEEWYEWMVTNVTTPMTEAQIAKKVIDTVKDPAQRKALNSSRKASLLALEKDGRIVQDATDPKAPKYSVA